MLRCKLYFVVHFFEKKTNGETTGDILTPAPHHPLDGKQSQARLLIDLALQVVW